VERGGNYRAINDDLMEIADNGIEGPIAVPKDQYAVGTVTAKIIQPKPFHLNSTTP
jgi:hypothetical protein